MLSAATHQPRKVLIVKHQNSPRSVAIIGTGLAGASCAASLHQAGLHVTLFDKARGVGGRMASRRAQWVDAQGQPEVAEFDHGTPYFTARHPRFKAAVRRAQQAGVVAAWSAQIHAAWPRSGLRHGFVAQPGMPAWCRHLLADLPVLLEHPVQRLQRGADGWHLVSDDGDTTGPFDQVVLAMPPAQAARLLAGHQDDWADRLCSLPMQACWTLMATTDEPDWPWDGAEPAAGPLALVVRNDRKPGRTSPAGRATWVAHATPEWTQAHLEADPKAVQAALSDALAQLLPGGLSGHAGLPAASATPVLWHHSSVHRWRYASRAQGAARMTADECWWDGNLGLGVCGDYFSNGTVEAAWRSGDELADTLVAWLEQAQPVAETV